jgi:Domain of unknown function (DUF4340)
MLRVLSIFSLVVLLAVGAGLLFFRDPILKAVGLAAQPVPANESLAILTGLEKANVTRLDLKKAGVADALTLNRADNGTWTQPGGWPVRNMDANELLASLQGLKSRFQPETIGDEPKKFGLADDQQPSTVGVTTSDKTVSLKFGLTDDGKAYVRIDGQPVALRIAPDVLALVNRPYDDYRRKQLFPDIIRTKLTGEGTTTVSATALPGNAVQQITVTGPDGSYTLKRTADNPAPRRDPDFPGAEPTTFVGALADAWEWNGTGTQRDRVDPSKLRSILSALPSLFVEGFITGKEDAVTKLDKPERVLTVLVSGTPRTLRIGGVSRTVTKKEAAPANPQSPFPMPPQMIEKKEDYHYAKFENNPLVFEVKADAFNDLFVKPDDVRDATLARFGVDEVTTLTIQQPKAAPLVLTKRKGNPNAERDDDKQDRWYVGDRLAETSKVTELLEGLAKLDAKTPADRLDEVKPDTLKDYTKFEGFKITVEATAKVIEGDNPQPMRKYAFQLQARDAGKKKLAVSLDGWPSTKLVDDSVVTLAERNALAYRSRKLFDTAELQLANVEVRNTDATKDFQLNKTGTGWSLTAPLLPTDTAKATQLANDIAGLQVTDFVDDGPTPEKLKTEYGLEKPRQTITLGFSNGQPVALQIGAARLGKNDTYAKLGTGGVFLLNTSTIEKLEKGPLDLLSLELWNTAPQQLSTIEITRGAETYTLKNAANVWSIAGPFEAPASQVDLLPMLDALAILNTTKYDARTVDALKHGLDKPTLQVKVTFGTPPTTRTLAVGKATGDMEGSRYARLVDGPNQSVFLLNPAVLTALDRPALGWLDRGLLKLDPAKITKIDRKGTAGYSVTYNEMAKAWKAEGFDVDPVLVGNLVMTASQLNIVSIAAYGSATKWADYGLDKSDNALTLTVKDDPKPPTVVFGKELPTGERYVRVDDGPAVGVISGSASSTLSRGKLDVADRTLLKFDPSQLVSLSRKMGKDEFELASGTGWDVLKPAKFKADSLTVDDLADGLGKLRALKVADLEGKDLKPFGLDAPAAELTLTVGLEKPQTYKFKLGGTTPEGDRFIRVNDAGPVKVLTAAFANRLLAEPVKFKDKTLVKFVDADILKQTRGDRAATFTKVDGTWKMTAPLGTDAEQTALDDLVNLAARLRADEIVAEKPADLKQYGLDAPTAKLEFLTGDKTVLGLFIGKLHTDGKRAYAKLEQGDVVALLDVATTAKLLGEYRKRTVWSGVDAAQVQSLVVSAGETNFQFRKAGQAWIDPTKAEDIPDVAVITDTLSTLAGLKAERYAADKDSNLKLFGLDKPSQVIVLVQQGGVSFTLQLGGEVGGTNGKQVYAKVGDPKRTDVVVLSEEDTAKLRRDRTKYLGKK